MLKKVLFKIIAPLAGIVILVFVWQFAASFLVSSNSILPSPVQVFQALLGMSRGGILAEDVLSSLIRILIGFLIAFLNALIFALVAYRFSKTYDLLKSIMDLLSSIPPIAWTPLAILWFGIGNTPAYFIVFLGAFFPMFSSFYSGVKGVDQVLIGAAKTLGASNRIIMARIIIPASLPQFFVGIKVGLGVAWFNVIAAELIGVKSGLGYKIQLNRQLLDSENVIGLMLVIGSIGLIMGGVIHIIANVSAPWDLQDSSKELWFEYHRKIKNLFRKKSIPKLKATQLQNQENDFGNEHLLAVEHISKEFHNKNDDEKLAVFNDISFSMSHGEVVSIIGPNGCGKTTILNIISGLIKANSGSVIFDTQVVLQPSSNRTVVFQNFALFPWLTAEENIDFAMKASGNIDKSLTSLEYLEQGGLKEFSENYPFQLSGGMKQRLAIMRAISARPKLILMDEPFASFDPLVRVSSQENILNLLKQQNATTVLIVTHDIEEAIFMSDRVIILSERPAVIKEIVKVNFPRPRKKELRREKDFLDLKNYLWNSLDSK